MIIIALIPFILIALVIKLFSSKQQKSLAGKHVVITGGSSGIGKCVAVLAAKKGADVTIIARDPTKLAQAHEEIEKARLDQNQIVTKLSCDVSNSPVITAELQKADNQLPIYMIVNCAGIAICGELENISDQDVDKMIKANFLGTLYPTRAVIPMMKARKEGIVVVTASQVALMGMFGYSVYASCKFALRGLSESLCQELKPHNISVTLALPPDTDTPGYELENKTKPKETKLISEAGGLLQPEVVAEKMLEDALSEKFFSHVGFESWILTTLCVGMSPFASLFELLVQSAVLGPLRLMAAYYVASFEKIVKKCYDEKEKAK